MIAGFLIQPQAVFAASNAGKFYRAYTGSCVDGRSNQMFHQLNKGTAQIKVEKCGGYTKGKKAALTLRKSKKRYPFYTNCGTVKFYKNGTYSFGKVRIPIGFTCPDQVFSTMIELLQGIEGVLVIAEGGAPVADINDVTMNTIGGFLGYLFYCYYRKQHSAD